MSRTNSGQDFVHLHVHTEYSMLDGAARLDELFAEVNRVGQTAIATTDHGYLFGAFEFWSKARAAGIKPIIGVEAYLTPEPPAPTAPGCSGANAIKVGTTSRTGALIPT